MELRCGKCKSGSREATIPCNGVCGGVFHVKCVGFSKYETDALLKHSNLKFLCDTCIDYIKGAHNSYKELIELIKENGKKCENIVEEKISKVNETVKQIKKIITDKNKESQVEVRATYADKLKGGAAGKAPVILKPKTNQESEVTKKEVKTIIQPSKLSVGVMAIRCDSDEARKILVNDIKEKVSEKYDIQLPTMRKPKILISGLSEVLDGEVIINAIKSQNNLKDSYMKCLKVHKSPKNPAVHNALLEIGGKGFEKVMSLKKINVEWDRCKVYESNNILRCFKCWGFNHKAAGCKENDQICAKCGEKGHTHHQCTSELLRCVNCVRAKQRFNLGSLCVNHDCRDTCCQSLQKKLKIESERIQY
ncbi:PREDICTED: uncharacterized protein LOC108371441 [Rhagoletis zephyria]|uniref:uncharacterized protein LOC108371441 n=1 Tax=Rhagoletis zephyria TaxID=28612 RepID=UPI0008115E8C|nr:PREDICTED: uncharacterized protein LOC108371441 [Rhagoletis zephyria]